MSVTYFQNMPIWNRWVLHEKIKELLHPILVSERSWFSKETVFAGTLVLQGTGFAGKLVSQGIWFRRETGSTGKLVTQGNWLRRKAGFARKLVRLRTETGFAGKLVSQGNWFLVTLAKIFITILVVKGITYNAKVSDITVLWFLRN